MRGVTKTESERKAKMTIFHVFSIELLIAVVLMLTYTFFNDTFVRFEKAILRFARKLVKK